MSTTGIVVIGALLGLAFLVWKAGGTKIRASRRMGARVAAELGIPDVNLVMTILEHGTPAYTEALAAAERSGQSAAEVSESLLPHMQQGILSLKERFGPQPQLIVAWDKIQLRIDRMEHEGRLTV